MRFLLALLAVTVGSAQYQAYRIQPFAGGGPSENTLCTTADLFYTYAGIASDASGNLFVALPDSGTVVRCDAATHILTRVAGTSTNGFSSAENLPGISVRLSTPVAVAVDSSGNLYIAETGRVRKLSNGIVTTIAGIGIPGYSGDGGPATSAQIDPAGIAVDSSANVYIAEGVNARIRKVSNGIITTIAGNGSRGFGGDNGPATAAELYNPHSVTVDSSGNFYVGERGSVIRKVSNGIITSVPGTMPSSNSEAVAVDGAGNLYAAGDSGIVELSGGSVTTIATALNSQGIALDAAGNVYFTDLSTYLDHHSGGRIRELSKGVLTTVVGGGFKNADHGLAAFAQLGVPYGVAVDSADNLYFSDQLTHRIHEVSGGNLTMVAGNGTPGFSGDGGPAPVAQLSAPGGISFDSDGALYIADSGNNRIRKVSGGVITTIAGSGAAGFSGDGGPATSAALSNPVGVAVDRTGNLYIADLGNNRVRKVSNGIITTAAGSGAIGYFGDNEPAVSAQLNKPYSVAVDSAGNLYIADYFNGFIRKVDGNGIITTIAGAGSTTGNGIPAAATHVIEPSALAFDAAGNLYFTSAVEYSNVIQRVAGGLAYTIAGGSTALTPEGPATAVYLGVVNGMAVDSKRNVYIADSYRQTIDVLTPFGNTPVTITHVLNAATNQEASVSPGEIVVITGSGLGPARLTMGQMTSDGVYDTGIVGSSVQVSGFPAPMIYASATQVAAVMPYGRAGNPQITVTYQGQVSAPHILGAYPWESGIFTLDGSGQGQAAAINQDGTVNGSAHPADPGSVISLYATGEGTTVPAGIDGKPASAPLPAPYSPVSVTIAGQTVTPDYAGGAPGEIAGVMQVNVRIPANAAAGNSVSVTLNVAGATSPTGVTIAIR